MEPRLLFAVVLLLALPILLLVSSPRSMRCRCRERDRLKRQSHLQLLVDKGEFRKFYKMSYRSFMALAAKFEPFLGVNEQQSCNRPGTKPITSSTRTPDIKTTKDLAESVAGVCNAEVSQRDLTVSERDASVYRRVYNSSDLSEDTDTYSTSKWIRDAVLSQLEHGATLRPQRSTARQSRELLEE
ncbi:hypothetical protein JG687_00017375 [Phytophthora cactorum]|uniref:Uncharacterized protein n=1 Tax=Phytophthora cactorum TaxID=29920 RepID=A0A8T1TQG5_9STRA|nr:hypothetical protein GQ600_3538 [Phytophthora cactorum]KAF1791728.1 hypothetical protein GQ600_8478 [Phytophthora cactorum]KAG6945313.1 hypothetical protein JG687_00017375 [Phytophthora cactorum]